LLSLGQSVCYQSLIEYVVLPCPLLPQLQSVCVISQNLFACTYSSMYQKVTFHAFDE